MKPCLGIQGTHLSIAADPETPLRVVAGPGTGKTFALMRRVARLLEQGAQPNPRSYGSRPNTATLFVVAAKTFPSAIIGVRNCYLLWEVKTDILELFLI